MTEFPRDPKIQDLVGATEASEILGVSRQTVVLRAATGSLLGAKIGKAWIFRRVVVERDRDS